MLRWDIFCKVVDNFGDIGVCWRLAKQLQREHGLQIRLWVDDLQAAHVIVPSINIKLNQQVVDGIVICNWFEAAAFSQAADVVIEAFACELPAAYLAAMSQHKSKWINLEYLSAEPWVDDFHGKPSPKPEYKLTRHFYFPGFTEKTGGLIREAQIHHQNQLLANSQLKQNKLWQSLKVSNFSALKISLFCYPNAPIGELLEALSSSRQLINCLVPSSSVLPEIARYFGKSAIAIGDNIQHKNLQLQVLPFLSQANYDALLSACDVNFVRGEDSWIRAIWAGKPFIWQPYVQDENAHMQKLEAFLNLFYGTYAQKEMLCKAHRYWSAGHLPEDVLNIYLNNLNTVHAHTQQQSAALAMQPDLATKLVAFCNALNNP